MTITLGRIGVPTASGGDGTTFDDPHTIDRQGRRVTLTGLHASASQAQLVWWARQLVGLVDGEEPVVPFTCSTETDLDGYYRVLDVAVAHEQGSTRANGWLRWQVQLEQVRNYRHPRIDLATAFGVRTNGRSITTVDGMQSYPGPAAAILAAIDADSNNSRPVADSASGAVVYLLDNGMTASGYGVGSFVVEPADYYIGGCRVEHDLGSSTYRQCVGLPDFPPVDAPSSQVLRLGNGMMRATFTYGNSTVSEWEIEWWDGSQWDAATVFELLGFGDQGELTLLAPAVLRNTAEAAAVRFRVIGASLSQGLTEVDFSTRRGQRWLTAHVRGDLSPTGGWRAQFASSTASTTITGGLRRTSNNAGGNREIIVSATNATNDTTNGRVTTASIAQETFGFGCEVAGSSATGQNTAANQVEEWFAAVSERAVVVAN